MKIEADEWSDKDKGGVIYAEARRDTSCVPLGHEESTQSSERGSWLRVNFTYGRVGWNNWGVLELAKLDQNVGFASSSKVLMRWFCKKWLE